MTLLCKLCGHQIRSLLEGARAQTSVIDQLMHHLSHQHRESTAELAATIAAASGYLAVRLYATIPDQETELRAGIKETERELFGLLAGDAITALREFLPGRGGQGGGELQRGSDKSFPIFTKADYKKPPHE